MIEKRNSQRYRVLKHGTLAFGGGGLECTVRNVSATGALIDVDAPAQLPPSFVLAIESEQFLRRCRPVWTAERRVGVAFD